MNIDNYLIQKTDKLMTWAQKHHAINLATTSLLMWVGVLIFSVGREIVSNSPISAAVWFLVWGFIVVIQYRWWVDNRDYFENHRKTQHLNAVAVSMRETGYPIRLFSVIFSFLTFGMSGTMIWEGKYHLSSFMGDAGWFLIFLQGYLITATFMGPGEFAKKKKEVFSGDMARNKI